MRPYEKALDNGIFNTAGLPAYFRRCIGYIDDRAYEADGLRIVYTNGRWHDDDVKNECIEALDNLVESLIAEIKSLRAEAIDYMESEDSTRADYRRDEEMCDE